MTRDATRRPHPPFVFPGELAGRQVLLRPLAAQDQALFDALYADVAVMARVGPPLAADRLRRTFAQALADCADPSAGRRLWRIQAGAGGPGLGLLGLTRGGAGLEVGVLLLAGAQGRGHASDAIATVAGAVFAAPGVDRLWARHRDDHRAAAALMRALGFRRDPCPARPGWALWSLDRPAGPRPTLAGADRIL